MTRIEKNIISWDDSNEKGGAKYGYDLVAYARNNQSNKLTDYLIPVYGATVTVDVVTGITATNAIPGG